MNYLDFPLILIDLYKGIKDDDKNLIENLIEALNEHNKNSINEPFYLETSDLEAMKIHNDAFQYLLEHYKPRDENGYRTLWKFLVGIKLEDFYTQKISIKELDEYTLNIMNTSNEQEFYYKCLDLIRFCMLTENYNLINQIKERIRKIQTGV